MKQVVIFSLALIFTHVALCQGVQLRYLGGNWNAASSWVQINTPAGQTPIQRVPTELDDLIIDVNLSVNLDYASLEVGGTSTTGYRCKSMHISNAIVSFNGYISDYGGSINVYTGTGGFVLIDNNSTVQYGIFTLHGGNPTITDFEIKNSAMGQLLSHQQRCNVYIEANGIARFINSTLSGGYYTCGSTGGSIYAENSTFNMTSFRIGDNGYGNLTNCTFQNNGNNVSMSFIIGRNVNLITDNLTITSYVILNLCTSGKTLRANINILYPSAYVEFSQIIPSSPLPNIIAGNIQFYEGSVIFTGDLSISGNFLHSSPPFIYTNFTPVYVNSLPVFYHAGSPSYPFTLELFGNTNTKFTWPVGFKVDTLIINKNNCAKADFVNGLYVKGETRIKAGQFVVNPIDTVPYQFICGGDLKISSGGGLFLRRNAAGTVASIAVNGNIIDSNLVVDSLCYGLSNPYGGDIILFRTAQNTGSSSIYIASNASIGNLNFMGVASSSFTLVSPLTVNNFTFTNAGKMMLENYDLTVKSTINNYASDKFFVTNGTGRLKIENIGNNPFVFPVGPDESSYNPLTLQNLAATNTFSVNVKPAVLTSGVSGQPFFSNVVNRTWFVEKDFAGTTNVNLTAQWNAADELLPLDRTDLLLHHYISGGWDNGTHTPALGSGPYTLTRNGISSLSPFAVMSSAVVLPLRLISFSLKQENNDVELNWITEQEINVEKFIVERSIGSSTFIALKEVPAKKSPGIRNIYTISDQNLTPAVYYYRLKIQDIDGSSTYSKILTSKIAGDQLFFFYPTPAVDYIYVKHNQSAGSAVLRIINAKGSVVRQKSFDLTNAEFRLSIADLPSGLYTFIIESAMGRKVQQIVKQ